LEARSGFVIVTSTADEHESATGAARVTGRRLLQMLVAVLG